MRLWRTSWWWEIRCWKAGGTVAGKGNVIYYPWSERLGGAGQLPWARAGQGEGLSFSLHSWHGFIFTPLPKWCWTSSSGAGGVGGECVGKAPTCEVAGWDGRVVMRGWDQQQSFSCLLLLLHFWPFLLCFILVCPVFISFWIVCKYFGTEIVFPSAPPNIMGTEPKGFWERATVLVTPRCSERKPGFLNVWRKTPTKKAVEELTKSNLGNY